MSNIGRHLVSFIPVGLFTCFKPAFKCFAELVLWDSYKHRIRKKNRKRKQAFYCAAKIVSEKRSGEVIKLIKGKNKQTNLATKYNDLIKRLPRPFQQSLSKHAMERETFPSAELGLCDQHTRYYLLLCSVKRNTVLTLYFKIFFKKRISFAKLPHIGCNVQYLYAQAKSKNYTCCHINIQCLNF